MVYSSGPGDAVDVERVLAVAPPEAQVRPHPGGLDQHVDALACEELLVPGGLDVGAQGEGDVGIDVVLRGAGGVVRRRLLAVDGAPRVQRAPGGELGGPSPGGRQHGAAEAQRVPGVAGRRVHEVGHHVDLGVPEVVPSVAGAGHPLGRDALSLGARCGLRELVQAPADGLLELGLVLDLDVGARPVVAQPALLVDELLVHALGAHPVQGAADPGDQLGGRLAARGVVADHLAHQDRHARLGVHPEHVPGQVRGDLVLDLVGVAGLDEVVGPDGERHAGVLASVPEQHPLLVAPVHLGLKHPAGELLGASGVADAVAVTGLVVRLAVGPVDHLGGDRDGHLLVQRRDLVGEDGEVALGEGHHPPGAHQHAVPARGAPQQLATEHPLGEVQGALVGHQVRDRQDHGLVVDVQLEDRRVRRADDGLAHLREPVGLLGMPDAPRLVHAVEERAVVRGVATLLVGATDAQVPVADREQRLGGAQVLVAEELLGQAPLVDRETRPVQVAGQRAARGVRSPVSHISSARSATTRSAPACRRASGPTPRSTPMTSPNPPARPAAAPDTASSTTTARSTGTPRSRAAWT